MNKDIARLQFITSPETKLSYQEQIRLFTLGGGNWVQLRMKDETPEEIEKEAIRCFSYCMDNGVKFILNDHVEIAARIGADGVHLGKNDMAPSKARQILGEQTIIGGTANTFEDIKRLVAEGVDYIGLGPFRFTSTKKNLSPILGLEGYEKIFAQCKEAGINIPIIAIGGLTEDDFKGLFDTGVHGVALSSNITESDQPGAKTLELLTEIGKLTSMQYNQKIK